MKIIGTPDITRTMDGYKVIFNVPEEEVGNLYTICNNIKPNKEYNLSINPIVKSRSTDANAYAWKLIGLISREIGLPPLEVYQRQILDMFCYRDILTKDSEIEKEKNDWQKQGYGWLALNLGPSSQHEGYSWLRKFRGSSSYTSTEMSKFLDNIIFEAQELGIETDTAGYVSELKNNWKEKQLG